MNGLKQTLNGKIGTFIALSTILGSGMMILPGTSYAALGRLSWIPWALAAITVIPFLYCYAWLGKNHPSSAGVSHYASLALGRPAGSASGILAGFALVFGIPATAITGGVYIATYSGVSWLSYAVPVSTVLVGTFFAARGGAVSGRIQMWLMISLFISVAIICSLSMVTGGEPSSVSVDPVAGEIGFWLVAVYVAFTGWETVSFTFEEHKRSDLIPRIFVVSYVCVISLYALFIFALYATASPDDPALTTGPLVLLGQSVIGEAGAGFVTALVAVCILANVCASILALSRLAFGLSRSGIIPVVLSRQGTGGSSPTKAVVISGMLVTTITLAGSLGAIPLQLLFVASGGVYFVLYAVGAGSYVKLSYGPQRWIVGLLSLLSVLFVTAAGGRSMVAPWIAFLVLLAIYTATFRLSNKRSIY